MVRIAAEIVGRVTIGWRKNVTRGEGMAAFQRRAEFLLLLLILSTFTGLRAQEQPDSGVAAEYARAEALVRNHQWEEGLEVLRPVLQKEPRNLKALNLAGIACAAKGDTQEANRYFERSLAVDPRFLPALRNLSISEFNAREYAAAEKHLMAAQAQTPNDPTINLYLGQIAYRQRKYNVAAERLDQARSLLSRSPVAEAALAVSFLRSDQKAKGLELLGQLNASEMDAESQLELGVALAEVGSDAEAIPYLKAAFERNPESGDVGFDLALACVRAKSYADAITTIQEVVHRGHDSSELEDLYAEALEGQGETDKAIEAYRSAIALDPKDENNYVDFASLCVDHHAYEDGKKVIAVGLEVYPGSERLTFMRGILDASEGNVDLAEKDFEEAGRLAPQRDLGAVGLGAVSLQRGDSGEAIKVIRRQLSQKPNDPTLLYMLGEALITGGAQPGQAAYAEAQRDLEKSVASNGGLCLPHVSLGTIYLQEDRFADAVAQFEAARAIDPNENSAYSHLAVAYRHLGQTEKAKEVLTALQELLAERRSGVRGKAAAGKAVSE